MMNSKKKNKVFTWSAFAVACVAFSTHCGAGFAAGAQEVIYFTGKGWYGPLMPLITLIILLPLQYVAVETARVNEAYNYKDMTTKAYAPFGKIGSILFEIGIVLMMLSSCASVIAGGGTIINDVLGLEESNLIGTIIVAAIIVLIICFGSKAVSRASTVMTIGIIITISILAIVGISYSKDTIVKQWSEQITYSGFGNALWFACLYAGMQCMTQCMSICSNCQKIQSSGESKAMVAIEFVINATMLIGICFLFQGFMPEIMDVTLPTPYTAEVVSQAVGIAWLGIVYPILYLLAALTTGVNNVFGFTKRITDIKKFQEKVPSDKKRYLIVSIICIVGCWGVAQVGFITIVKTLYSYVSTYSIFAIIIPMIILGLRNLKKAKAAEKESAAIEA